MSVLCWTVRLYLLDVASSDFGTNLLKLKQKLERNKHKTIKFEIECIRETRWYKYKFVYLLFCPASLDLWKIAVFQFPFTFSFPFPFPPFWSENTNFGLDTNATYRLHFFFEPSATSYQQLTDTHAFIFICSGFNRLRRSIQQRIAIK